MYNCEKGSKEKKKGESHPQILDPPLLLLLLPLFSFLFFFFVVVVFLLQSHPMILNISVVVFFFLCVCVCFLLVEVKKKKCERWGIQNTHEQRKEEGSGNATRHGAVRRR